MNIKIWKVLFQVAMEDHLKKSLKGSYHHYRGGKSDVASNDSPLGGSSKMLGRKEKKQKQSDVSDIGITSID